MRFTGKLLGSMTLACMAFLASDPAHALRCGSRLVKEGMHETEVKAICGKPVSERSLGYVLRSHFDRTHGLTTTRGSARTRRDSFSMPFWPPHRSSDGLAAASLFTRCSNMSLK